MQLKDIVCDIEYAEKLEALGVKKESCFCFFEFPEENMILSNHAKTGVIANDFICNAYTTDELIEMLPDKIEEKNGRVYFLEPSKFSDEYEDGIDINYTCSYADGDRGMHESLGFERKLSNALAQLLIWCIEQGHVKVNELNGDNK